MNFSIPVYERRRGRQSEWTTLGLGEHTKTQEARTPMKLRNRITAELRKVIQEIDPAALEAWVAAPGIELKRVRLELSLRGERGRWKASGVFPLIVEPRAAGPDRTLTLVYHPARQEEWFPLDPESPLSEQAERYFARVWGPLSASDVQELKTEARDRLRVLAFRAEVPGLLDKLPDRRKGLWDDLEIHDRSGQRKKPAGGLRVLPKLGVNLTERAVDQVFSEQLPRSPYRELLQLYLSGGKKTPAVVVGPPRVGKSTIVRQWVRDLMEAEGYASHRNLDRLTHVWAIAGRQMIAGMSYVGDWEQRCKQVLHDATSRKIVLLIDDLQDFSRLGQHRDSERSFADFFRGPLQRGELVIVGEVTPEGWQRLEDEAASFAACFNPIRVEPTTPGDTYRMLLGRARQLEWRYRVAAGPAVFRTLVELGGPLFPGAAFPGKALDLLEELCRRQAAGGELSEVGPPAAIRLLSRKTGLPPLLLEADEALSPQRVQAEFERVIKGQSAAIGVVRDLILKIRTGLTDARRPYAVYLFTGPTGTGKTELCKCLAEYLYGDARRLTRLDMGEYGGPDAPARLIGDRFEPRGGLTGALQDQPFCVLLLDEIDKSHPAVLNLLLQLFDEGRLTDAAGRPADATHAVIVMTSNLGARAQAPIGFGTEDEAAALLADVARAVRDFFPPELFNRIDRVVPFGALSRATAREIAAKEVGQLLSRRGLVDRNIFARVTERATDRVVDEAFDPRYGARPVKRYLEERIGSLLADAISRHAKAEMQSFHVYLAGNEYRLHAERLQEAETGDAPLLLEDLLAAPARELHGHLPRALDALDALASDEAIAGLQASIAFHLQEHQRIEGSSPEQLAHADALYYLEEMRGQLRRLKGRVGRMKAQRGADRREILLGLAEVAFMKRALDRVRDPDEHAVELLLESVGSGRGSRRFHGAGAGAYLLRSLALAYGSRRGDLDGFAVRRADGDIGGGETFDAGMAAQEALRAVLELGVPTGVLLRIGGLGVRDFFTGETGSHYWSSTTGGSEVVRVEVRPASPLPATEVLEDRRLRAQAFVRALEQGAEHLPDNPDALLPIVRRYHFDPPRTPGARAPLDVEDYPLGYADRLSATVLADALTLPMLLRMGGTVFENSNT